jgi:hypothetical protein
MWLSTSVNAHLYKGDGFIAYLKLKNPELKPPSLVISPKFNQQIASHTSDRSSAFFPEPFDSIVAKHEGRAAGWAVRHAAGATELTADAPEAFFDALYRALAELKA